MSEQRVRRTKKHACAPGTCQISRDPHTGLRRCSECGFTVQTLVDHGPRHPLPGDRRVVCEGDEHGVCAIGPSKVFPAPHEQSAIDAYNDHQRQAVEQDGSPHNAQIITFPLDE